MSLRADAFRMIARGFDALALAEETERPPTARAEFYSADEPPPGFSWRRVLEQSRRGAFPVVRAGRNVLVRRADFDRWLDGRERPGAVRDGDAELASALGLQLVQGGRR